VLAVAHRGDPAHFRENTLEGLESGADCGADWVELDVKVTADGEAVLLHDLTLHRLWEVDATVEDLTLADLSRLTSTPQWWIPTLDQALQWAAGRGIPLMVDIPRPVEGRATVRRVAAAGRWDLVVFAGDPDALVEVRAYAPHARIAMSWELPHLPDDDLLRAARPDWFNQLHELLTQPMIDEARAAGMAVCAYVVNEPERMRQLAAMGVGAIISDDIRTLVQVRDELARDGVPEGVSGAHRL
jgi:glycerophosphoryl diester phosphodiesterase